MKLIHDKYYTDSVLAEYCVNKTKEILELNTDTMYIEPSAGGGAFLDYYRIILVGR